jgi:hypothetical protein
VSAVIGPDALGRAHERVGKTQGVRYNVPTVIREEGFDVRICTFDHPPPHVHRGKGRGDR